MSICVHDGCSTATAISSSGSVFVPMEGLTAGQTTAATVVIEQPDGQRVFDAAVDLNVHTLEPNGPDCAPAVPVASVTVGDGDALQGGRPG